MATNALVYVTGFKQLDAKLRNLPAKLQRKFVRGGLRKTAKRDLKETKRIINEEARDTGALEKSLKNRAMKRSRTRAGVSVYVDREKLFLEYEKRHGRKPNPVAGEREPFYYFAAIEFGTQHATAVRPMRRALYDNAIVYREYFRADVTQLINENKVSVKL